LCLAKYAEKLTAKYATTFRHKGHELRLRLRRDVYTDLNLELYLDLNPDLNPRLHRALLA